MRTGNFETKNKAIFSWFLSRSKCSIISCHDSREDTFSRQRINCWKIISVTWLVTTLEVKKAHNFQDCIRGIEMWLCMMTLYDDFVIWIEMCYTRKRLLRLLYQTASLKTFTTLTNLGYFMKFLPNKTYKRKPEKISGG